MTTCVHRQYKGSLVMALVNLVCWVSGNASEPQLTRELKVEGP